VLLKIVDEIKSLKFIVVSNDVSDEDVAKLTSKNFTVFKWVDFLKSAEGQKVPDESAIFTNTGFHRIAVVMFTSGSTGTPKGVCLTNKNFHWVFNCLFQVLNEGQVLDDFVSYSFLP